MLVNRILVVALAAALVGCGTLMEKPAEVRPAQLPVAANPPGAPAAWPFSAPPIHARSAILIDARTGKTLYQKDADTPLPVASTQKLLTALVVLEKGALDQMVRIQPSDARVEPTKLGLRPGETYSRRKLLSALIVKSENDAAAALARDASGTEAAFAAEMNRKARELDAVNSHFANAHGLPAPQHSTARDMARIAYHAYREPLLRDLMATREYPFVLNSGRVRRLENTNKLLGKFLPVNGMKTGYTNAAGRCLIASASANGRDLIFVQLGSRTNWIFNDAERILRWGLGSTAALLAENAGLPEGGHKF